MLKLDKDQLEYLVSSWVHELFRTTISLIPWMTNKSVCDSFSSASMTFNQALNITPRYDRGPLPSSSCWYWVIFTSGTWLIEPGIEVYFLTSYPQNQISIQFYWPYLSRTPGFFYCVSSHHIRKNISTLTSDTPGQLVLHLDAEA